MVGPLWGFYSFIKDRGPDPLAIDQYQYFLTALHNDSRAQFDDLRDLLAFTKVFWLTDNSFSKEYDNLFYKFFDLEGLEIEDLRPLAVAEENLPSDKPKEATEAENTVTENTEVDAIRPILPKEIKRKTGLVDFELVLKDSQTAAENLIVDDLPFRHDFKLRDADIMPFNIRNFTQRLRRKVETSEKVLSNTIDIEKMIKEFTEKRFIETIHYRQEDSNQSNVVLFSDRFGSMFAYEHLDLLFRKGFKQIPYCNFEHYFFYNLPDQNDEGTEYLLKEVNKRKAAFESSRLKWSNKTWFFVLSDAGGHSGNVNSGRLKATLRFWKYLNTFSENVHWINPVPFEYLNDCTAKRLQMVIPMTFPDEKSMNSLILQANSSK